MKVAEVRYTGRSLRHNRRGPSDQRYSWNQRTSDVPGTTEEVDNIEDAMYFDDLSVFEVEWSPLGRLAKETEGAASEAEAALQQIGYRQKQKIAKSLGLKAGGSEEELEDRLEPEIERLKEQMEIE